MTSTMKVLWFAIRGVAVGAALAVIAPPKAVTAGCNCWDTGVGGWQCLQDETGCYAGDDKCYPTCT